MRRLDRRCNVRSGLPTLQRRFARRRRSMRHRPNGRSGPDDPGGRSTRRRGDLDAVREPFRAAIGLAGRCRAERTARSPRCLGAGAGRSAAHHDGVRAIDLRTAPSTPARGRGVLGGPTIGTRIGAAVACGPPRCGGRIDARRGRVCSARTGPRSATNVGAGDVRQGDLDSRVAAPAPSIGTRSVIDGCSVIVRRPRRRPVVRRLGARRVVGRHQRRGELADDRLPGIDR